MGWVVVMVSTRGRGGDGRHRRRRRRRRRRSPPLLCVVAAMWQHANNGDVLTSVLATLTSVLGAC